MNERKKRLEDGAIRYTMENGNRYTISAEKIARAGGEAVVDKKLLGSSYTPSPYDHPDQYKHLYDKNYGDENSCVTKEN